jgi:hypothetical protein
MTLWLAGNSANAAWVAFDFDTDGDPSTIQNEIVADVGDLVQGYLVVGGFPEALHTLSAIQFGLESSSGLAFRALAAADPSFRWGVLIDGGTKGIAMATTTRIPREDLPIFLIRFVYQVTDDGLQEVKVAPSRGWGRTFQGIVYAGHNEDGDLLTIEDDWGIGTQIAARVSVNPTPVEELSWGAVKDLYN